MKQKTIFVALTAVAFAPAFAQEKPLAPPPIPNQPESTPAEPEKEDTPVRAKPVEPAAPKEYVVQSGDNPWLIAKNHGVTLQALLAANEIKDAKNLKVGDVLKLPDGADSKKLPVATPVAESVEKLDGPTEGDDWELYTIKKGDNPWNIAKAMKVEHSKIMSLNKDLDFTKLNIGQQIKVPKKK